MAGSHAPHLDGPGLEEQRDGVALGGRLRLVQEGHAVLQRVPQRAVAYLGQVGRQRVLRQLQQPGRRAQRVRPRPVGGQAGTDGEHAAKDSVTQ